MSRNEPLPASVPLTLYRGDTRVWTDVIERNTGTDAAPVWEPYDLAGHEFLAQIRSDKNRADPVVATIAVEATDPEAGEIELTLTAEEADNLGTDGVRLNWDLQIIRTGDGFTRTHLAGPVTVKGDVADAS